MKNYPIFFLLSLFAIGAAGAAEEDIVLTIGPETYLSSDSVTLCRVYARNTSGHAVDGKTVAFEAQAWENGEIISRERGRFGGKIEAGQTVESRIGFVGAYRQFSVEPVGAGSSRGGGSRRPGKGKGPSAAKKTSRAKASGRRKKG